MTGVIWLDITGMVSGSDTAILAQRLGMALRARLGDKVRLCDRSPGLTERTWSDLAAAPPRPPRRSTLLEPLQRTAARLPPPARAALRRATGLQLAALRALRPAPRALPATAAAPVVDTAAITPGDTLLMLLPRGDAARLHEAGLRLAFLPADMVFLARPDWLTPEVAREVAVWTTTTRPLLDHMLSCPIAGEPGAPELPVPDGDFVLADGEIGIPGQTGQLLLAWRGLLDEMPVVPKLVLAGHVGLLASDVLAQLRNSDGLGGHVTLVPEPTQARLAALRRACRFVVTPEPHSRGRATLDALAAGRPCLSAFPAEGATPIDPTNVAALTATLRVWLDMPPAPPAPPARTWSDVAAELLQALAP